eukprot:GHVT01070990.1.p1 GENE.GHVT01070990.1~~GHVT01070990.1.p1  ORF type:complete len:361 (+),score=49.53 GHVT01070990.1:686-1768(+)
MFVVPLNGAPLRRPLQYLTRRSQPACLPVPFSGLSPVVARFLPCMRCGSLTARAFSSSAVGCTSSSWVRASSAVGGPSALSLSAASASGRLLSSSWRLLGSRGFAIGARNPMMHVVLKKGDAKHPPASSATLYENKFDHAAHPALWKEEELAEATRKPSQAIETGDSHKLVEPTAHPHQSPQLLPGINRKGTRYTHYNQIWEPTFPKQPDLSKGELAAGANVTRTSVWHDPKEPAITSVSRFTPEHFRPAGYAQNVPIPDSINSEAHPDYRHYRLPHGHADRRPATYFMSASCMFVAASYFRAAIVRAVHYWWISKDLVAAGSTEVDLRPVSTGTTVVVKWRGKPVFVRKRSEEDISRAR